MNRPGPIIGFWITLFAFGVLPTLGNVTTHVIIAWACAWGVWAGLETLGRKHEHHDRTRTR